MARQLGRVSVQPGPIPRVQSVATLAGQTFRNGAFMRSTKGGAAVQFTNPEGFLVVYEAGDPVRPTVHFSRLNVDGSVQWTADTGIGRLTQILPHESLPAFVGQASDQLTEPMLAVLHVQQGTTKRRSLKGPLN